MLVIIMLLYYLKKKKNNNDNFFLKETHQKVVMIYIYIVTLITSGIAIRTPYLYDSVFFLMFTQVVAVFL